MSADAAVAWSIMQSLVLDNHRRQRVAAAVSLPFGRIKALRRICAADGLAQRELAMLLGTDAGYTTVLIDDLVSRGLVTREPHPTDRRSKVVRATEAGDALVEQAEDMMGEPPAELLALPTTDLEALARILASISTDAAPGGVKRLRAEVRDALV